MSVAADVHVNGQQSDQSAGQDPQTTEDVPRVREVGGRLIASGETVVVRGDPGEPPRGSSIATKVETPLVETPRSVSIWIDGPSTICQSSTSRRRTTTRWG
jgi:hypothetical protein